MKEALSSLLLCKVVTNDSRMVPGPVGETSNGTTYFSQRFSALGTGAELGTCVLARKVLQLHVQSDRTPQTASMTARAGPCTWSQVWEAQPLAKYPKDPPPERAVSKERRGPLASRRCGSVVRAVSGL